MLGARKANVRKEEVRILTETIIDLRNGVFGAWVWQKEIGRL